VLRLTVLFCWKSQEPPGGQLAAIIQAVRNAHAELQGIQVPQFCSTKYLPNQC